MTARYILENKVILSTKRSGDQVLQSDKKVEQDMEIPVETIVCLYYLYIDEDEKVSHVSRTKKVSKNKKNNTTKKLKYGIEVTQNIARTKDMDDVNGGMLWQYAIKKELYALVDLDCFEFKSEGYNLG